MRVALHTKVRPDRVDAYEAAHREVLAELEQLPVNVAWQARMAELLDVVHDYSHDGADAGLPAVWELP
ncbi:hypothetical protein [Streptomyces gossypiisoli]|uniref:hypothetical protein n=1 Tax=Streptomyces gossypiisoli TaxID=2748864 RepID=UPI0015D9F03E|nr:hypothetical protein [Streptomyces gossypiisoli]